jgi:ubiquinone/menaquinone biosynthesis C-methylase UbiE
VARWGIVAGQRRSQLSADPLDGPADLAALIGLKGESSMPHQQKALQKYAGHAGDYDRTETDRVAPMRRAVIATLGLKPGHVVLDVGCGTGLSFPLLEESVGPGGRIVGIDQSPDMLLRARARVADRGWQNVTLVEAPAAAAEIPIQADAALFHFTHDIMRTPRAVANVVEHLKPGGHVVAIGIKWAPWWRVRANLRTWRLARAYTTTFEGLRAPWSHLADLVPDLHAESLADGFLYFARGTKKT